MRRFRRLRTDANQRRWDVLCVFLACGFVAFVFWKHALLASRVVDGVRWWYLDDDMMISMRYGRNLAEGHGLVWNEGERVEGYSNFLWTMVMALVHKLGAPDRTASLWVRGVGFVFLCGTLVQSARLVRVFAPRSFLAVLVMLVATIFCVDVIWWSAWGFESSLLTFLFLTFLVSVLHDPKSIVALVALSLVPLTRADATHIWMTCALAALVLAPDKKQCARRLAFAAAPLVGHIVFRRVYYEDWFPNTYYLKVYLLDGATRRGLEYVRNFLMSYAIPLVLAAGGALTAARRDRRALVLFILAPGTLLYVTQTGGDIFGNSRFCSHLMPLVFVFAAVGIGHITPHAIGRTVWAAVMFFATVPLWKPLERVIAFDANGDPREQIVAANAINKNARPDSSIAVIPAGIVPYFTRRRAIDLLGKSDKRIARMTPIAGAMVAHGKVDPDYSLGELRPDIIVSCRNYSWTLQLQISAPVPDPVLTVLTSRAFILGYRPNVVQEEFTLPRTAIYTSSSSPEAQKRAWKNVIVGPWP